MKLITVTADKTLGIGDDGTMQCATALVTITIPVDATHLFLVNDTIEIFNCHTAAITLDLEEGVDIHRTGTNKIVKDGHCTIRKIGVNEWLAWGDLV